MKTLLSLILALLLPVMAHAAPIGVGDSVLIELPGEPDFVKPFVVDRQGRIVVPQLGPIQVQGSEEAALRDRLKLALSQYYLDLGGLNVTVTERRLLVRVLGYVNEPGEVLLDKNATLQMVLEAAGGLRRGAQLDQIQVQRATGKLKVNYKAYLDSGDASLLPELVSLDTIFVPASPKTGNIESDFNPSALADGGDASSEREAIKVFGEVTRPGSFAYKEGLNLVDLLMRAGGVTRYASVEQIRVISSGMPAIFNLKDYLDTGDQSLLPAIAPGTTLFVPKQEEEIKMGAHMVYVMGEVFKPGAYESKPGVTFLDILANAGGPTRFAESRQIRVIKHDGEIIPFDLAAYTEGLGEVIPAVEPGDSIFVPEKTDLNEKSWLKVSPKRAVHVLGEVGRPGRVEWSDEMSLMDLLAHVGGPTRRGDTTAIEILSQDANGVMRSQLFNLDTHIEQDGRNEDLPMIGAGATVRVPLLPDDPSDNKSRWVQQDSSKSIYIFGAINAPGRYMTTPEMDLIDVLTAADSPSTNADLTNVVVTHRNEGEARVSRVDLAEYFVTGDESLIPDIKAGDSIYIPTLREDAPPTGIRIMGEVRDPSVLEYSPDKNILDLLTQAGGPTRRADTTAIKLVIPDEDGRMRNTVFDLEAFMNGGGEMSELPVLTLGSTIIVPLLPDDPTDNKSRWVKQAPESSIYVFGAVNAPGRYMMAHNMTLLDLLTAADSPSGGADIKRIVVNHRSEGRARVSEVNLQRYLETGDESILPHIKAGDTIFVPFLNPDWLSQPKEKTVRVLGAVNRPGRYQFSDNMTILDLLAEAGGTNRGALVERITVVNFSCCAHQSTTFNLKDFAKTADFDKLPVLREGDTVYIPDAQDSNLARGRQLINDVFQLSSIIKLLGIL